METKKKREGATSVPKSAAALPETPFQSVLRNIVKLAPAPSDPASTAKAESLPEELALALKGLEREMALKLRAMMIAGRDGQSLVAVHVAMTASNADAASATEELRANSASLADYLQRGHAIACATGFDLEKPITEWPSAVAHSLDERAWLSFGRQLAKSSPDDWKCLGVVDPQGTEQLTKLYVRLGDLAWWSFQTILDRPSLESVETQKRALTRRRSKGVANGSLRSIADRTCASEGRALRRAVRAIRARMGVSSSAP